MAFDHSEATEHEDVQRICLELAKDIPHVRANCAPEIADAFEREVLVLLKDLFPNVSVVVGKIVPTLESIHEESILRKVPSVSTALVVDDHDIELLEANDAFVRNPRPDKPRRPFGATAVTRRIMQNSWLKEMARKAGELATKRGLSEDEKLEYAALAEIYEGLSQHPTRQLPLPIAYEVKDGPRLYTKGTHGKAYSWLARTEIETCAAYPQELSWEGAELIEMGIYDFEKIERMMEYCGRPAFIKGIDRSAEALEVTEQRLTKLGIPFKLFHADFYSDELYKDPELLARHAERRIVTHFGNTGGNVDLITFENGFLKPNRTLLTTPNDEIRIGACNSPAATLTMTYKELGLWIENGINRGLEKAGFRSSRRRPIRYQHLVHKTTDTVTSVFLDGVVIGREPQFFPYTAHNDTLKRLDDGTNPIIAEVGGVEVRKGIDFTIAEHIRQGQSLRVEEKAYHQMLERNGFKDIEAYDNPQSKPGQKFHIWRARSDAHP